MMRFELPIVRALACTSVSALLVLATGASGQTVTARVVAVHDGDTITVREATGTVRVRLADVDAPELGQPYSGRAREFTSQLLFDRVVTLESRGTDQYDRLVARVRVDGVDASVAILRAGLAWRYSRGAANADLADAERSARERHAGLWGDQSPVPPWVWRRTHRAGALAGPTPPPHVEERAAERVALRDARGPFRGNTQSRVFHRLGCPHYRCKHCDEEFLTTESALDAGYRPAGDCLR